MSDPLTLREYRPADRARVLAVHEAALRDEGVYVEDAPEPDLEDIRHTYTEAGGAFLVGEVEAEVVATGAYRTADGYITDFIDVGDGTAELKRMRVAPGHQGQGSGRAMYEALERRARAAGFSELVLDTMPSLTAARGLYESVGFEMVRHEQFDRDGGAFELLFYRKPIEP